MHRGLGEWRVTRSEAESERVYVGGVGVCMSCWGCKVKALQRVCENEMERRVVCGRWKRARCPVKKKVHTQCSQIIKRDHRSSLLRLEEQKVVQSCTGMLGFRTDRINDRQQMKL